MKTFLIVYDRSAGKLISANEYATIELADDYQAFAESTMLPSITDNAETYLLLGLASEVGEVHAVAKRAIRDGTARAEVEEKMLAELGDVLWYVACLAAEYDLTLSDVMRANIEKLTRRKANNTIQGEGDER